VGAGEVEREEEKGSRVLVLYSSVALVGIRHFMSPCQLAKEEEQETSPLVKLLWRRVRWEEVQGASEAKL
jgi:hypothetical protein